MTKYRILLFIIFLLASPGVFSQTILLPKEEAPFSIFSSNIGDADVDLYLSGSWETEFRGGFGYAWDSTGKKTTSSFPGMAEGYQLTHQPDIIISLWLMDRYFFETSFIDNYDLNTILFGYEAVDEGFLRSVRIGNTDIGFGDYSWLQIPEASADSMGGMVLFKNDKSEHQLMIRYDPAEMQVKSFIGKNEIDLSRAELTDYIQGRYFILPDDDIEDLKVYIEDSTGIYDDGKHQYRLADSNDAIISAEEGIVFFREALTVRAAVYYKKGGATVGNESLGRDSFAGDASGEIDISTTTHFNWDVSNYLGQDMYARKLIIGSETALLLYEPGVFSPFEMLSVYSIPYLIPSDPTLFKATLADINLSTGENIDISTSFEDYTIRVLYNGDSYRNPANRYPLALSIESDTVIYEQNKQLSGSPPDKDLLFQRLYPIGNYYLGDNVLDGSVSVTINNIDEYRYNFDPDSGTVNFLFSIPTDAQIEIKYRTIAGSGTGGDLLLGLGSRFYFSEKLFLETGAGLRWNVLDSKYTEEPEEAAGSILGTAGLSYTGDNLDFRLDAGISIYNPNTTGILRLAGMNKNGYSVPVSADFLYPAAPPESGGISPGNRGILYYKDYHEYDSSGSSTLRNYTWSLPADQIYAYANGGRTGPYIAGTGSEIEGNAAVIDYNLGNNEWTGGRIPLTLGSQALDLSGTQSISLQWKHITEADNVTIYLRVGKLAEDLDSDGTLDEEISSYESGFDFNHGSFNMKVGLAPDSSSGNDQIDTEDLDGNDILDEEGSNLVLTMEESTDFTSPGSNWETLNLKLSPADRKILTAVTGLELIIVDNGTGSTGRLLVGDITFSGSSFVAKPATDQIVTVREINELYATTPGSLLSTDFPEIDIFYSGTGAQNVAEISWDTTGIWKATTFTESVDLSDYSKISFYMKTPASDPEEITFSMTNPSGKGISFTFEPVVSTDWVKYTIDYRKGSLTANDELQDVVWISRKANSSSVNRITISANCISDAAGTLLLDEIHLEDPVTGVSGAFGSTFNYRHPGSLYEINKTTILSNLNFSNSSQIIGRNFASGFTNNSDSTIYTATDLSLSLFSIRINGNLDLQWQDYQLFSSPGISFTMPFLNNRVIINDSYSEINLPLSESVTRENSITAKTDISLFKLYGSSVYSSQNLLKNWGLSSNTAWRGGSQLSAEIDFIMKSEENPYENLDSLQKLTSSYELYLPGNVHNDRTTKINISPGITTNSASYSINETLSSDISGLGERVLETDQSISFNADISFNEESHNKWYLISGYKKSVNYQIDADTDINFFTDTKDSLIKLGTHNYYFTGVPLWEIFFPDFGNQFIRNTKGQRSTEYTPKFSIQFKKPTGSTLSDIIIPSFVDLSISRNLNRDFDSVTDKLNANIETRATALNLFGQLGTTPLVNWYQTEEITNILSVGGQYRSYMTDFLEDPLFNINYTLYLNFSINQENYIDFESSHNWIWLPLEWNSSTSGSYKWLVKPEKTIKIPILYNDNNKPYYEHIEKITVFAGIIDEGREQSLTLTANHTTNLIISDTEVISLFAGIGWEQTNISIGGVTTKYYMVGIEAGISAKLTF